MASMKEYRRRSFIPLVGIVLAAYYLVVLVPLNRSSRELDEPLNKSWKSLSAALGQTNTVAIDFAYLTNQLNETRDALALLDLGRRKAAARVELGPSVLEKVDSPFQLVEYQNERSLQMDTLTKLAKQKGVALEPAVLMGLPEHTADITQPELLWAALSVAEGLLTTALQCKVGAIHTLESPLTLTNTPSLLNGYSSLAELPFRLELTGPFDSVAKFMHCLPLRGEEVRASGLPEASKEKPPIFIERLVLMKQTPEKPDEVRLSLDVKGFVLRR